MSTSILPHTSTLTNVSKISIKDDKPIMLDYYVASFQRQCKLVKTQDQDTILYKSNEEYTSPLNKLVKVETSASSTGCDVVAISENSIYILHSNILGNNAPQKN
jgi:hypothetical protein